MQSVFFYFDSLIWLFRHAITREQALNLNFVTCSDHVRKCCTHFFHERETGCNFLESNILALKCNIVSFKRIWKQSTFHWLRRLRVFPLFLMNRTKLEGNLPIFLVSLFVLALQWGQPHPKQRQIGSIYRLYTNWNTNCCFYMARPERSK